MTLQEPISDALELRKHLESLDLNHPDYAVDFVRDLLAAARVARASDIHIQPTAEGFAVDWRLDGVLHNIGTFRRGESTDVVVRMKVLAELLTYRTDVPQEGRIRNAHGGIEMRVSTFPTLYGERAVVRLFAVEKQFHFVADLGLPTEIETAMCSALYETSGALIISGPAGSGKTTTAYACLRELVRMSGGGKSIVSLEDPIEVPVDGVAQSQVQPSAGFDLATGLRSVMRQDPEVILVGEIRDRDTAETVFQAALTGHLVVTTFHAGSASEAVSRLSDMGIEPYLLRSGIVGILSQRLVRNCALVPWMPTMKQTGVACKWHTRGVQPGVHNVARPDTTGVSFWASSSEPNTMNLAVLSCRAATRRNSSNSLSKMECSPAGIVQSKRWTKAGPVPLRCAGSSGSRIAAIKSLLVRCLPDARSRSR